MTQIFTVTDLNERIKDRLENDPRLHDLWAQGEVSNFVHHRSGHRYFTLKDRDSQISCVLFKNQASRLDFELQDGLNILVYGDIAVYRPQGRVQLVAQGVKQDVGLGFRHLQFEALKKKLGGGGALRFGTQARYPPLSREDRNCNLSARSGAARCSAHHRPLSGAHYSLSGAGAGAGAGESIVSALLALQGQTDVVIVCRGGGSTEDLWCFNSEAVARAIFGCDSPVISAVGHETDVTIADFVADMRAATPTAAAKMAVPDIEEVKEWLRESEVRMVRALWTVLERKEERLEYLQHSISARRMYSLATEARQRLDYLGERLAAALVDELMQGEPAWNWPRVAWRR